MKVEIWSDVMCPFCYIGKRHYETALKQFPDAEHIEVEWKSFQLDPTLVKSGKPISTYEYLASRKGVTIDVAREMTSGVATAARTAGLNINFDKAIIANTRDAHRMIHFAQSQGKGNEIEERLFEAHFIEGLDVSSIDVLAELAKGIGLDKKKALNVLTSDAYLDEVNDDIRAAQQIGVRGVPFFVFDRKYAVSGAQPASAFLQTLEKSFAEWREKNPLPKFTELGNGASCSADGCD